MPQPLLDKFIHHQKNSFVMIKKGSVVLLKSNNLKMTVDDIIDCEEVECRWWDGNMIQIKAFLPTSLIKVEDSNNNLFSIGDVVTLKSGSPRFVIAEIDGDEVSLECNSNTYNSWLFKKV